MVNLNPTDPSTVQLPQIAQDPGIQDPGIQEPGIQELETTKGKKRLFSEIQEPEESGPPAKKTKTEEENDPAYEALKAKEVGWLASTTIKVFARQGINSLVSSGKIKRNDEKHKKLQDLVKSHAKTYADLERIGTELISCLYSDDADRKQKEINKIRRTLVIYDTEGAGAVWTVFTKSSDK